MHGRVTRWSWSMLSRAAAQEESAGATAKEGDTTNLGGYTHAVLTHVRLVTDQVVVMQRNLILLRMFIKFLY